MKRKFIHSVLFVTLLFFLAACASKPGVPSADIFQTNINTSQRSRVEKTIYAHIAGSSMAILLADNSSAEAFADLLSKGDITIEMHDYGSFEKVGNLGVVLPANDKTITTQPGDVILYQGNSVAIYYDTNTWSFTKLGKVQGLSRNELKEILGDENVTVTFSKNE